MSQSIHHDTQTTSSTSCQNIDPSVTNSNISTSQSDSNQHSLVASNSVSNSQNSILSQSAANFSHPILTSDGLTDSSNTDTGQNNPAITAGSTNLNLSHSGNHPHNFLSHSQSNHSNSLNYSSYLSNSNQSIGKTSITSNSYSVHKTPIKTKYKSVKLPDPEFITDRKHTQDYDIEEVKFASGKFANVYRVKLKQQNTETKHVNPNQETFSQQIAASNLELCAKIVRRKKAGKDLTPDIKHEVSILQLAKKEKSPFIINLIKSYEQPREYQLILEYYPGEELWHHLIGQKRYHEQTHTIAHFKRLRDGLGIEFLDKIWPKGAPNYGDIWLKFGGGESKNWPKDSF